MVPGPQPTSRMRKCGFRYGRRNAASLSAVRAAWDAVASLP